MSDIPGDITTRPLGEVAKVYSGGTPSRSVARYWGGTVPWVSTAEIGESTIVSTAERITEDGLRNSAARVAPAGTLLMAMYGQGKTRGKTAILGIPAAMNQACAAIEPHAEINPRFLLHYLQAYYDDIRNLSNAGSQENLSGKIVRQIPIRYPLLVEQERIAAVLDDAADAAAALERVIAKKRAIKQGMMQELLTGRTRLPGFSAPWTSGRLGDLYERHTGTIDPRRFRRALFQHFSLPAFDAAEQPVIEAGTSIDSLKFTVPPAAVLLSKLNPRIPRIWAPKQVTKDAVASTEFVVAVPLPGTNRSFLKWLLKSERVVGRMNQLATGTTKSHVRIQPGVIASLEVAWPSLEEQAAIALILDDVETEIEALKRRLEVTRAIRQGMMQELLTGRARLAPAEVSV